MFKLNKVALVASITALASTALADSHEMMAADTYFIGMMAIGAGLAIGLSVLGAALGQGNAAKSALEGISRNPSSAGPMFVPLILSLVFMEALGILAFLIAFFLNANLTDALSKVLG